MHSLVFSGDLREYLASTARFIFFQVLGDKGHGFLKQSQVHFILSDD